MLVGGNDFSVDTENGYKKVQSPTLEPRHLEGQFFICVLLVTYPTFVKCRAVLVLKSLS